ncbi:MAG: hypothetical protein WC900_06225 [Oscillospiraceae bacterium]|jgi:hypothetical protein
MASVVYTVKKIDGDYVHLQKEGEDDTILVARAFLPLEANEDTLLLWENLEYTII